MESTSEQNLEDIINPQRLRYQNNAKDTFLCSICKNLLSLLESKICSNCGEQFCKKCKDFKCPLEECDSSYHNGALPKSIRQQLENLEIKCKFIGCPNYIQLKDLNDHQSMCNFRRQMCEFCNLIFDSELIQNHKENCTDRVMKCNDCSYEGKLNHFDHNCKIFQRFDLIESKYERMNMYDKKFEEIENKLSEICKLLKIPNISKERRNKRRIKKAEAATDLNTNKKKASMKGSNLIQEPIEFNNVEDEIDAKIFKLIKLPRIVSKALTVVCELRVMNCLLVGNDTGEIKLCNYYEYTATYSPNHGASVTYILNLQTSDNKFITAGEDNKLIIRKLSDENYYEIIEQEIHSLYLEKTNVMNFIISVDSDHKIRIWDLKYKKLQKIVENKSPMCINRFNKDDSKNYFLLSQSKIIELYDLDKSQSVTKIENEFKICFILYYKGNLFLTYDEKNIISLWDIRERSALDKFQYKGKGVLNCMFIVKSNTLAFVTSHREIFILDLSDNKIVEVESCNLLSNNGDYIEDEIYFGSYNKILALFKRNSHYLHLFKLNG